ncbi:MAG: hypothetical protein ACKVP5_23160 [Aestuariivirga sp.]
MMMKIFTLLSASAFLALAPMTAFSATPMSEADCLAMMKTMDKNADGSMDAAESAPLLTKLTEMKIVTKDPTMVSKDEFLENCKTGTFEGVNPM